MSIFSREQTLASALAFATAPRFLVEPAVARMPEPQFHRDEGDHAWWTHASTPGVH